MPILDRRAVAPPAPAKARQQGAFSVEFAIVFLIFLMLVFGALELARIMYVFNTVQEVTRVAASKAATADFSHDETLKEIRQAAVFDRVGGKLPAASMITADHVTIDYLSLQNDASGKMSMESITSGDLPTCPARNKLICTANMASPSCIRLVRVRICKPGTNCEPVPYSPGFPFFPVLINVPMATTIVKAQSLGYTHGMELCD